MYPTYCHRGERGGTQEKTLEPMGKMVEPSRARVLPTNSWFVTVHEDVYFGPTTEISQMSAAASPLLRAVVPRCPAPTGDRVAPRLENNRLSPSSLRSSKLVFPRLFLYHERGV